MGEGELNGMGRARREAHIGRISGQQISDCISRSLNSRGGALAMNMVDAIRIAELFYHVAHDRFSHTRIDRGSGVMIQIDPAR